VMVPGAGWVSLARVSRRLFTGSESASRLIVGNASSRLTEMMCCKGTSSGMALSLGTATSQQIAT